jgi:hypothetical protein
LLQALGVAIAYIPRREPEVPATAKLGRQECAGAADAQGPLIRRLLKPEVIPSSCPPVHRIETGLKW